MDKTETTPRWAFKIMCSILGVVIMVGGGAVIRVAVIAAETSVKVDNIQKTQDNHGEKLDLLLGKPVIQPSLTYKE